jgi:hypothetical protein
MENVISGTRVNLKPGIYETEANQTNYNLAEKSGINSKAYKLQNNNLVNDDTILNNETGAMHETASYYVPVLLHVEYTDSGRNFDSQIDTMMGWLTDFRFIATDMSWIIQAQTQSIKNLSTIQNNLLEILNSIFAAIKSLADGQYEFMQTQEAAAKQAVIDGARRSGIMSVVFGVLEVALGAAITYFSSGIGAAVGAILIMDGISKIAAGSVIAAKPELLNRNDGFSKALSQVMQSGLFSVFAVFGNNGPIIAQSIAAVVMAVFSLGTSLISSGAGILANGYLMANAGVSLYGMISGIVDQFKEDEPNKENVAAELESEKSVGLQFSQAAAGGILACFVYITLEESGLSNLIKEKWGENALIGIEMTLFFLSGIVGISVPQLLSKISAKMPQSVSQFGTMLSKTFSETQWAKQFEKFRASIIDKIPGSINEQSLTKAGYHFSMFNNIAQVTQSWIGASTSLTRFDLSEINNFVELYKQVCETNRGSLEQYASLNQGHQPIFSDVINEMAKQLQGFYANLIKIVNRELNYNSITAR